ncbi:MAG: uL15 family ribosomal protein [Candidatus Shapirobacteria bacterium]|nr:uL15 family ribosomal protein [Candidatus Shapirobacteria bacterium]MDD5073915.1 uL15 family ribosomal protein [Candidatus Shapirobacteria bacterium]MDD5481569.1 uL15 family ribosomal protein [Candidatus Shapirobacteria bacterium]
MVKNNSKSTVLSCLPKSVSFSGKRVGRGYGSGKGGHTVGRGAKGLKARSKRHLLFEGRKTQKSLLRRTPLLRGKGKLKSYQDKPIILSLDKLNIFKNQLTVDQNKLIKEGLIDAKEAKRMGVKVLANGELKRALKVALPVSAGAKKAIEEAGGEVVESQ